MYVVRGINKIVFCDQCDPLRARVVFRGARVTPRRPARAHRVIVRGRRSVERTLRRPPRRQPCHNRDYLHRRCTRSGL